MNSIQSMIQLLTYLWLFHDAHPAQSTLTAQAPQAEFAAPADATTGFTVKCEVNVEEVAGEKVILEIPEVLSMRVRRHNPLDRKWQNYPAFKMPDGSVPVLEGTIVLHSKEHPDWKEMTVGIPLAMLKKPMGAHEVVLHFSGVRWTMYVDGELLDNDFPFGYPRWPAMSRWKLDPAYVKGAAIYLPALTPEATPAPTPRLAPVQYWTPPGHNSWVGDVATYYRDGRYHLFYLYDRRHHRSRFNTGAHYFEHLSTTDFKQWTEHEAAVPIDEQWESIGTGTPFVFQDKFCLAYGLHTARLYPTRDTNWPAQQDYLKKNGRTGSFPRGTPGIPIGATYSVSADGVGKFQKTSTTFHHCQNPSIFTDAQGRLRMFANAGGSKGTWESDSPDGGWRCIDAEFPPGWDCTFPLRWGRFDYVIGGFKGLWSRPADAPDAAFDDLVAKGLDFYDGLNVPAITEIAGGRFVMAGWTKIRGWGGQLVLRELMQFPDGRIGSRWMPELTPATGAAKILAPSLAAAADFPVMDRSFLLSFEVQPAELKKGRLAIGFLPGAGTKSACEWQLRLDNERAQFAPYSPADFAGAQKSLREGGFPQSGSDYAIEHLIGVERPFTVRLLVKSDDKLGGSVIDAEIAGRRTMLTYRADLLVGKLFFRTEGADLRNVQLAPLQE